MADQVDKPDEPLTAVPADRAVDDDVAFVERLAAAFSSHPGFMWTESGFEVLHAEWPAYPRGHGLGALLERLAEFPPNTQFFPVDNIDQCTLFVVGRKPERDPYSKKHLHIALWDEDLREAARRGYVSEVQAEEGLVRFPEGCLTLTPAGTHAVLVQELVQDVPKPLLERVQGYLDLRRYDAAVREAALLLELRMRAALQSQAFGQALVDECFGLQGRLHPKDLPNAYRLTLHAVFRTFFAFVRNEYAHNIPEVDLVTTCRLLRRCGRLFRAVDTLARHASGGV